MLCSGHGRQEELLVEFNVRPLNVRSGQGSHFRSPSPVCPGRHVHQSSAMPWHHTLRQYRTWQSTRKASGIHLPLIPRVPGADRDIVREGLRDRADLSCDRDCQGRWYVPFFQSRDFARDRGIRGPEVRITDCPACSHTNCIVLRAESDTIQSASYERTS
eukprot:492841-Rhodomonas_salina.1